MFDSEAWKKFTIRQCLKKINCVSMRHEQNCQLSMSEKNAPPPNWTKNNPLLPIYSDPAPCHQYQVCETKCQPLSLPCTCKNSTTLSL